MARGDMHSRSARTLPDRGLLRWCLQPRRAQFSDSSCPFCSPRVNFFVGVISPKEIRSSQMPDARLSSLWGCDETYPVTSPPPQSEGVVCTIRFYAFPWWFGVSVPSEGRNEQIRCSELPVVITAEYYRVGLSGNA